MTLGLECIAVPFLALGHLASFLSGKGGAAPEIVPPLVAELPVTEKYVTAAPYEPAVPLLEPEIVPKIQEAIGPEYVIVSAPSGVPGKITPLIYETRRGGGGAGVPYRMI